MAVDINLGTDTNISSPSNIAQGICLGKIAMNGQWDIGLTHLIAGIKPADGCDMNMMTNDALNMASLMTLDR